MEAHLTYPSRSPTPNQEDMSSHYIPRHTSAESRFDHQGNHFDPGYQPFHSAGLSDFHRPHHSSTWSHGHPSQRSAERKIAELEVEVSLLRASLRMQKDSQAVSAARIAALTLYLEGANQDIEEVIEARHTQPEHAYLQRCDTAMANAHISRRFLRQMRDESGPANFEDPPRQVYRTNSSHDELPVLHEPTPTALKSKRYRVHGLNLPPIREVFRNEPWVESGPVGQHVEREAVSHLRPIVETSKPELHPEVSAACATCLHDSLLTSRFPPHPSPPFQPRSPCYEPVSHICGLCGPAYSPTSPSYEPASPSYEPASPGNRSLSPVYGASPSISVHRVPNRIYQYESPANQLASSSHSPGRVFQAGSLVHRTSSSFRRFPRGTPIRRASEQRRITPCRPFLQQLVVGSEGIFHEDVARKPSKRTQTVADELQPVPSTSRPTQSRGHNHSHDISPQRIKRKSVIPAVGESDSRLRKRTRHSSVNF